MNKQPRRKGNAKTASSARAAELLASSGHTVPFIGFDGCSALPSNFSDKVAEASCDDIDPEVRNALKKMTKKDALTREKGLKEMAMLMETLSLEQMDKCFPAYASAFPKLTMDGVLVVRTSSIRLLESFIKKLKKNSERHMKKVLPYVVFAMHDSYGQVVQSGNSLVTECFTEENRRKAIAMCMEPTCDIALQILERTHPLLPKGEGEETESQRECRLSAQSLECLATLCERLDSVPLRERIVKLLINKQLFKLIINSSPQVMSGMFSVGIHLLPLEWADVVVLQSSLPVSALSNIDNTDRTVCRSAVDYLIEGAKRNHLFNVLNINKAVIPKLVSVIRRKESHWMNLESKLMVMIKLVYDNLNSSEKQPFLRRVLDAFFDGTPFDASFKVGEWASALVELIDTALLEEDRQDEIGTDEDFLEFILAKVLVAMDLAVNSGQREAMRTISSLPLRILSDSTELPEETRAHFRHNLFMNLFNRLPSSEPVVEQLFTSSSFDRDALLAEMILRSPSSSVSIVSHIIESLDQAAISKVNTRVHLANAIAPKVDWQAGDTRIVRALLKVIDLCEGSLSEFVNLEDEMCCALLVETASSYNDWSALPRQLAGDAWKAVFHKAALYAVRTAHRGRWQSLLQGLTTLPNSETVISQLLESNEVKTPEFFVDLMAASAKTMVDEVYREKITAAALNCIFTSASIHRETIGETLEAVRLMGITDSFFVNAVNAKLDDDASGGNCVDVALSLACALPSTCADGFLLSADQLSKHLSSLDDYDVEILERNALLSGSQMLDSRSPCIQRNVPLKHIRRAVFLMGYIKRSAQKQEGGDEDSYSLLYATAVWCICELSSVVERRTASTQMTTLRDQVKEVVLLNENGRRILLRSFVQYACEHTVPLSMLMAVRQIADGLDLNQLARDLKGRIDDQHLRQRMLAASCAVGLKSVSESVEWNVASAEEWVHRCELSSSLNDRDATLVLLTCFVAEARSTFEQSLFIFQTDEHSAGLNRLNCALLRSLQRSCSSLDVMDSTLRDFLLCALITALESCKAQSKLDEEYSQMFVLFASLTVRLFAQCSRTAETTEESTEFSVFRQEWGEFYQGAAESILVEWFLSLSDRTTPSHPALLRNLSLAMHYCEETIFEKTELPARFDAELDCKNYPERLQSVVIPLVSLVSHSLVDVQFAALRILRAVTVEMMLVENKSEENDEDEDDTLSSAEKKNVPVVLTRILASTVTRTEVPPVLLAWDAFVESLARFQLTDRVAYCNSMNTVLDDVMPQIFELLPENPKVDDIVLDYSLFKMEDTDTDCLPLVSQYVFGLFYRTLKTLPALVRQWYTSLPRAAANLINAYTTKYVSPLIWKKERSLVAAQKMPPKLEVRVLGAVREMVAEYDMEDAKMTLVIDLPSDYPLSVPVIENEKAIVNKEVLRKWLLQLTLFLAHQNGSLMDGILMWAKNIARHLDGAEDCTICMMTVHSKTLQLPKIKCKQCKNRFHTDCLRKWFESSSQSTCPLCRSNFRTKQI